MRAFGTHRIRRHRGWPMAVAAVLWLHATPALAARITAVRVGTHPGYTRVVFETDALAAYEVLETPADTPGEVTVRIAAESRARDVAPRGPGSPSVTLLPQPDGTTLARIRATGPLRVETQVLATPPRLVLDLRRAEGEVSAAATAPAPKPDPPPPPEVVETVEPQQETAAPTVSEPAPPAEPAPLATPAPDPTPEPARDPAETAAGIEAPPAPEPSRPAETLPAVDAPPPVAPAQEPSRTDLGIDPRSLAVGLATGFGIALIALAARRQRGPAVSAPEIDAPKATPESVVVPQLEALDAVPNPEAEAVAEPSAGPVPGPEVRDEWMLDVLRMHQRLDARLATIADQLAEVDRRQSRLEARGGAQNEELASQRTAIARLQRSLRPASTAQPPRQVG